MSDIETAALAIASEAVTGLAGPVRTSFLKALSDLLGGLTAIPAAKLRQYAQGIEDTTAARSTIAAMIAKGLGEASLADPLVMQAAAEVYLPGVVRKAKNRLGVAQKAAEHIAEEGEHHPNAAPPEDDWMNYYSRFAEDASSDKLQDLFGRILAGQIVRPGSFSERTIRTVAELDQHIAEDFSHVWTKSVGSAVDFQPEFHRGEGFSRWKRLAEVGLMAPSEVAQFLPPYHPVVDSCGLWSPVQAPGVWLNILFPEHSGARWDHIDFTRVGREIGSILPRPDYEANVREVGRKLAGMGVARVELHVSGKPMEIIGPVGSI